MGGRKAVTPSFISRLLGINTFLSAAHCSPNRRQDKEVKGGSEGFNLGLQTSSHISKQINMGQGGSAAVMLAFLGNALLSWKGRWTTLKNKDDHLRDSHSHTVADRTGEHVLSICVRLHPGVHRSLQMIHTCQ